MKILVYANVFYPSVGGIENLTLNLVKEFVKNGHEVKVITGSKQKNKLEGIEIHSNLKVLTSVKLFLWCDAFYMPNISLKGVWLMLFNPFKNWIVSHNDYSLYNSGTLLSKLKLLVTKFTTNNISVSKSVAGSLKTRSEVIYNCYDDELFKFDPARPRIHDFAFIGRLVSQKGCDSLIEACSKLTKPFTLNIIGDGPEKPYLKSLVQRYNLSHQITFLGELRSPWLAMILNQHKTLVIPSIGEEGFGIVVLEGMACGCNIISSNAGGLTEAVNNFGKLYQMGETEQLTKLMQAELDNAASYLPSVSPDLQKYLKTHSKGVVAQKYLNVFNSECSVKTGDLFNPVVVPNHSFD
jgi:glycogen(starch) synthase